MLNIGGDMLRGDESPMSNFTLSVFVSLREHQMIETWAQMFTQRREDAKFLARSSAVDSPPTSGILLPVRFRVFASLRLCVNTDLRNGERKCSHEDAKLGSTFSRK